MSESALLMAIRDQLSDSIAKLKSESTPVEITREDEIAKLMSFYSSRSTIIEPDYASSRTFGAHPVMVKYWQSLLPLDRLLSRIDKYIEATR